MPASPTSATSCPCPRVDRLYGGAQELRLGLAPDELGQTVASGPGGGAASRWAKHLDRRRSRVERQGVERLEIDSRPRNVIGRARGGHAVDPPRCGEPPGAMHAKPEDLLAGRVLRRGGLENHLAGIHRDGGGQRRRPAAQRHADVDGGGTGANRVVFDGHGRTEQGQRALGRLLGHLTAVMAHDLAGIAAGIGQHGVNVLGVDRTVHPGRQRQRQRRDMLALALRFQGRALAGRLRDGVAPHRRDLLARLEIQLAAQQLGIVIVLPRRRLGPAAVAVVPGRGQAAPAPTGGRASPRAPRPPAPPRRRPVPARGRRPPRPGRARFRAATGARRRANARTHPRARQSRPEGGRGRAKARRGRRRSRPCPGRRERPRYPPRSHRPRDRRTPDRHRPRRRRAPGVRWSASGSGCDGPAARTGLPREGRSGCRATGARRRPAPKPPATPPPFASTARSAGLRRPRSRAAPAV